MTAALFALTSLLVGRRRASDRHAGRRDAGTVAVALRMGLAGLLLLGVGRWRCVPRCIPHRDLAFIGLQGILFFAVAVAFIAFYESTQRIPSGLAALVLSTSSLFAALIGRALLGSPITSGLRWGALCGVAGVGIISGPGLGGLTAEAGAGFLWRLVAAVATAAGIVVGARNQHAGLPILVVLGWGALIGSVSSAAWAFVEGAPFVGDLSLRYVASLAYLVVGASCITFLLYFELVRSVGPGKDAYIFATVPIVALVSSALFEGLQLDLRIASGAIAFLTGNVLVLRK
jgi:drug/metabolite transporter (DMT)-like permease